MTGADAATPALDDFRAREARRRAAAYARFFTPVTARFAAALVRRVSASAGPVLDIGCGDGVVTAALRADGRAAIGLDHSPESVELARATGAPVVVGDAMALPVATGRLAAVTAGFVLPHLADLAAALGETARVLAPGGTLAMAGWAPAALAPFTGLGAVLLAERAAPAERAILAEAARRTDPEHLRAAVAAAGFADVVVETVSTTVELASADDWWKGVVGSSCGFTELLQLQDRETRLATRAAFLEAAQDYRLGSHTVLVPAAAVIVAARREG